MHCGSNVRCFSLGIWLYFYFLRAVVNIPIQTHVFSPRHLLRKMIISQLELGPPVYYFAYVLFVYDFLVNSPLWWTHKSFALFCLKFLPGATECFTYVCAYAKHMHSHGLMVIISKQIDQSIKFIIQAGGVSRSRFHVSSGFHSPVELQLYWSTFPKKKLWSFHANKSPASLIRKFGTFKKQASKQTNEWRKQT